MLANLQVDFINTFAESKYEMQSLSSEEIPELHLPAVHSLKRAG